MMGSDYYPPGVTGREYQIAGAEAEYTDERTSWCPNDACALFNQDQDIMIDLSRYGHEEWGTAKCRECGTEWEFENEVSYE